MIYGHGDDLYRYDGMIRANFSSNIYQHADLGALKRHLAERLDLIGSYPEPAPLRLESALAEESGISTDEVTATNGATEAIYTIAHYLAERFGRDGFTNIISGPTFSEYADACRMYGCRTAADGHAVSGRKAYWLCNPNNPTGTVMTADSLLEAADARPDDVFIIDQSYEHYTLEPTIADKEAVNRGNIILLHSMTKRFCVPGLRLGYATACRSISNGLKSLRRPWSVNALAAEAGTFLIYNNVSVLPPLGSYLGEAKRLSDMLGAISGISVMETKTNFMLARIEGRTAAWLKERLVREYGLLIRDAANFSVLDAHYFRVAAQTPEEDDMLTNAVKALAQEAETGGRII